MKSFQVAVLLVFLYAACTEGGGTRGRSGSKKDKISICKKDEDGNYKTISINGNAWPAHEAQGSFQGDCGCLETPGLCSSEEGCSPTGQCTAAPTAAPTPGPTAAPTPGSKAEKEFVMCSRDCDNNRILSQAVVVLSRGPDYGAQCRQFCSSRGHRFYGLQCPHWRGIECFCGSSMNPGFRRLGDGQCENPALYTSPYLTVSHCSGYPPGVFKDVDGYHFGGHCRMAIYDNTL